MKTDYLVDNSYLKDFLILYTSIIMFFGSFYHILFIYVNLACHWFPFSELHSPGYN